MKEPLTVHRWQNYYLTNPCMGNKRTPGEEAGQAKGLGVIAIAEAVVGMKKDDKKDVEADFPDDFEVAPLAGKR